MLERPARKADIVGYPCELKHRDCGGDVRRQYRFWECSKCPQRWKHEVVERFTDEQLGDRFCVRETEPRTDAVALVWKVDAVTKRRHIVTVPAWNTEGPEKVFP